MICIAFQAKLGRCGSYPETSSRVTHAPLYSVFQTLLSNNSGSFQHRVAEASEILFSGSSLPLWLLGFHPGLLAPLVASSRRSCQIATVLFNTETQRNRRFSSQGSPCPCGLKTKKESTSMRLTPESGGYLLSRNSVPSAIASLTSLFGMGRGGTSLP